MNESYQLKILILMAYYNRPILVRNALKSLVKANEHYQNWHLLFGDDGSIYPGKPIVEDILGDLVNKVTFIQTGLTLESKIANGLLIGGFANEVIKNSDADIGLILCDDDELEENYLTNLNRYFYENPNVLYAFSKIYLYNPLTQSSKDVCNLSNKYNQFQNPINPVGKVDASQVSWRLDCCKIHGAWFAETTKCIDGKPWTKDTDKSFFQNLFDKCGPCHPTGFVGQYKGVHDYQLLWHKNVQPKSLEAYDKMCRDLAGRKL